MTMFKSLFIFELKRRLGKRELILFLIILLIFGYFVNDGKSRYRTLMENKSSFQKIENTKVSQYVLYTQYGTYGLSILFVPSPFIVFYVDSGFDDILTNVNSGERLEIYKNIKGRAYFKEKSGLMNLRGMIVLFTVFFSLLYGYDTNSNREFLKYLSGLSKPEKLFFVLTFVRILILELTFFFIIGITLLFLLIQGINLFQIPLLYILLLTTILIIIFFYMGCVIGSFRKKALSSIILGLIYFFSIFLFPSLVDKHMRLKAEEIEPLYDFALKNLSLIMEVERNLIHKFGLATKENIDKPGTLKKIKQALNTEFAAIFANENDMISDMLTKIKYRHFLSNFYPVLFYNSTVEELSSCGGRSFIDFYRISKIRKRDFINFYVEKQFLGRMKNKKGPQLENIESFVKDDENLYFAKSRLPFGFWLGLGFSLIYVFVFAYLAGTLFKRRLYPRPLKDSMTKIDISLERGEETYIKTCDTEFVEYLGAILIGNTGPGQGIIRINGQKIDKSASLPFLYLCPVDDIPADVTAQALLNLIAALITPARQSIKNLKEKLGQELLKKKYSSLPAQLKAKILFIPTLKKNSYLYLIHGLMDKCDKPCTLEYSTVIKDLLKRDCPVVYLSEAAYPNSNLSAERFIVITREDSVYENEYIN